MDEIPDWEGRVEDDPYLQVVVDKHGPSHEGQLFRLPIGLWLMEDAKKHIIEQVRGGSKGLAAFDPEYYNTRSTFMEDAQKCYQLHLRPKASAPSSGLSVSSSCRTPRRSVRKLVCLSRQLVRRRTCVTSALCASTTKRRSSKPTTSSPTNHRSEEHVCPTKRSSKR